MGEDEGVGGPEDVFCFVVNLAADAGEGEGDDMAGGDEAGLLVCIGIVGVDGCCGVEDEADNAGIFVWKRRQVVGWGGEDAVVDYVLLRSGVSRVYLTRQRIELGAVL